MSSKKEIIRLATRGSALALAQARWVAAELQAKFPQLSVELVPIHTQADRAPDRPLRAFGDKAVFVREIQRAVLEGRADAAVHSLKDLPADSPSSLVLAAVPPRAETADLLIGRDGLLTPATLPRGARVATTSLRRRGQLLHLRPDLQMLEMRGNVDTRLRKLRDGQAEALVLAKAGLSRLNIVPPHAYEFSLSEMLPAACQGALGIEALPESPFLPMLAALDHLPARVACETERAFVRAIGADCHTPVACLCTLDGRELRLRALVCSPDGQKLVRTEKAADLTEASQLALATAEELLACGAKAILEALSPRGEDCQP